MDVIQGEGPNPDKDEETTSMITTAVAVINSTVLSTKAFKIMGSRAKYFQALECLIDEGFSVLL